MARYVLDPNPCSIDECEAPVIARGWCKLHYERWARTGSPTLVLRPVGLGLEARLRTRLRPEGDGCLVYTRYRNKGGYGRIKDGSRMPYAHRVAYELWVGPIPDGMFVCHHCDNPPCCNPDHLFVGDQQANMADMARKGRAVSGRSQSGPALRRYAEQRRAAAAQAAGFPADWKRCPKCDSFKSPQDFGTNPRRGDGKASYCRPCMTIYLKSRRVPNGAVRA